MKNALVTTTINIPHNLESYAKDIADNGPEDTCIIIAGDRRTPDLSDFSKNIRDKYNIGCVNLDEGRQLAFLGQWPQYRDFLPWDCVQRRNAAILYAYHADAKIIVTIDDDNLWEGQGYFKQHGDMINKNHYRSIIADWYNPCTEYGFYPRGYSFRARGKDNYTVSDSFGRRVVNAGLWIGDPDVDAVTRFSCAPNIEEYENQPKFTYENVLGIGTKCPFNSQNTALHRDVIPAYCLATGLGRYDDIVAGYIVKRIADHLGDYISFGKPIVRQVRNEHDLFKDLEEEIVGMQLIDRIVEWLYEITLVGTDYKECAMEIINGLVLRTTTWFANGHGTAEQRAFLESIVTNYRHWMKIT